MSRTEDAARVHVDVDDDTRGPPARASRSPASSTAPPTGRSRDWGSPRTERPSRAAGLGDHLAPLELERPELTVGEVGQAQTLGHDAVSEPRSASAAVRSATPSNATSSPLTVRVDASSIVSSRPSA